MFETTRRRRCHARDTPLLPCLLTLPPPGVCFILSLEPHLACTLLKSNFWSSIWTWKNKEGLGETRTFTMRTVCGVQRTGQEWQDNKLQAMVMKSLALNINNKIAVCCNLVSESINESQISDSRSIHSVAKQKESRVKKETAGTDLSKKLYQCSLILLQQFLDPA